MHQIKISLWLLGNQLHSLPLRNLALRSLPASRSDLLPVTVHHHQYHHHRRHYHHHHHHHHHRAAAAAAATTSFSGFAIDRWKKYIKVIEHDVKIDAVDP